MMPFLPSLRVVYLTLQIDVLTLIKLRKEDHLKALNWAFFVSV
jgi:hypothetical protein